MKVEPSQNWVTLHIKKAAFASNKWTSHVKVLETVLRKWKDLPFKTIQHSVT